MAEPCPQAWEHHSGWGGCRLYLPHPEPQAATAAMTILVSSLAHSDETTESHLVLSVLFCSLKKYLPFTHFELTGLSVAC